MNENEVLNTIKSIYEKFDKVLDPHSAIGYGAFDKVNLKGKNIVLATAHPSKFPEAIKKAINIKAELPNELAFILDEKENYDIIENNLNKIKQYIKERI
jgi:threonine synthase